MWKFLNLLFLSGFATIGLSENVLGILTTQNSSHSEDSNFELVAKDDAKQNTYSGKLCRYQEGFFPEAHWNWKVGAECYNYHPKDWFTKKLRIASQTLVVENVTYIIPIGVTEDNKLFGYDYTHEEYSKIVASSFKNVLYFKKWQSCARNGDICCKDQMDDQNIHPSEEYPCPAVWDAWSCFLPAKSDSVSRLPCPDYTTSSTHGPCNLYSQKQCFADGTWNQQTDYSACTTTTARVLTNGFQGVKLCRYRDQGLFPETNWNWKVGAECYHYHPEEWFTKKLRIASQLLTLDNVTYKIPIGLTNDDKPFGYDYTHEEYSKIVASSFKSDMFFKKWQSCARNGEKCCKQQMHDQNICPSDEYPCPATWDAWSCFLPAKRDSVSELPCPDYTSSSSDTPCILYSQKRCFSNGTWNQQTNYSTCATAPVYRRRHNFHVIVLYVSIALSFPAVVIFASYRNLRIMRVNLHRNLLIACIIRNIFTIMSKELVILDSLKPSSETKDVLNENGVACRMLAYFSSVAANAIYACMLMDGFYLHKLIVRIFSTDPNIYIMHAVTAVLSFLPTTIWAILLAIEADEFCWMVDSSLYQWIPDGFRIAILSINIILLIDIIRALLCKLRQNISAQHTKYTYILITNGMSYNSVLRKAYTSTLKAMFFLIPLFGVPFILTANRNIVNNDSCKAGDIYYYVSYSIQALQGIMVAVLFCYWNKEVHTQIKGTYRKINLQYEARFGSKNDHTQAANRRDTAATYVHNNSVAPKVSFYGKNEPVEEVGKKVGDWLTENHVSDVGDPPPLESSKNKIQSLQNINDDPGVANVNLVNGSPNQNGGVFNRISKFIDDSSESLRRLSGSTPSNQQGLRQTEINEMDELTRSNPNLSVVKNNIDK